MPKVFVVAPLKNVRTRLLEAALTYPGAYDDFPWGEHVVKVNKKIFAFLGSDDAEATGVTLKLPESNEFARTFEGVEPSGYGLGKAGWMRIDFDLPHRPDIGLLLDWLDESYRAIAPKRLVQQIAER